MSFVTRIGAQINPYSAYLPTGMQQAAQRQAGQQFLGGLAQNFLAAAGPSRYPMPTVMGLAGVPNAIQSAQQTQNVALQNAMNAQKLQQLQMRQRLFQSLITPQAARPRVTLPQNVAVTPQQNPYADFQVNPNQQQMVPTSVALPAAMARAGVPSAARPTNFLQAGAPQPMMGDLNRLALGLAASGDTATAQLLFNMNKGTAAHQNAILMGLRPGTAEYNNFIRTATNPPSRYEPSAVKAAVTQNMGVFSALNESTAKAAQTNQLLSLQKQLFKQAPDNAFGPGTELLQNFKNLLTSYGAKGLADRLGATPGDAIAKTLAGIATEITFDTTGKLKGAISEKEIGLAGEVASRITDTKNAALANIEIRQAMNRKQVMIAQSINKRIREMGPAAYRRMIENDPQALTLMVTAAGNAPENDISADIERIIVKYGGGGQTNTGTGGGPVRAGTTGAVTK